MTRYLDSHAVGDTVARHFESSNLLGITGTAADHCLDLGYFNIVRFFGETAVQPQSIEIREATCRFEFSDERVAQFSRQMEKQMRSEGRLCDGPLIMKAVDANFEGPGRWVLVQPARYGDQAGSCFALDFPHPMFEGWGGSLREYYLATYPSRLLRDNPLAIGLGVCGMLMVSEGKNRFLKLVHRSSHLASLENCIGPSAAGSVDWQTGDGNLSHLIDRSLSSEVIEELNLKRGEFTLVPLAWAQEIYRGEKPQLFCLVETQLSRQEVDARLSQIADDDREFTRWDYMQLDDSGDIPIESYATMNYEAAMNCRLVSEFLQFGLLGKDQKERDPR